MTHVIPVGTSEPQDFALVDSGNQIDGTGITVDREISRYVNGAPVAVVSPPTVAWLDEATGKVRVEGVEVLEIGIYLVRFKLTDMGSSVGFVPNDSSADVWKVVPVANR